METSLKLFTSDSKFIYSDLVGMFGIPHLHLKKKKYSNNYSITKGEFNNSYEFNTQNIKKQTSNGLRTSKNKKIRNKILNVI